MEPDEIFETPFDNPLYPHFRLEMRNVEILTAFYPKDPDAIRRLIPPPLESASAAVIVHINPMHGADRFGDYFESSVQLPVTLPGTNVTGAHSSFLYLGSDGTV